MSLEPPVNGNGSTSPWQRVAIAIGTLIIVVLTVVAALLLAMQEEPPAIVEITTSPTIPALVVTFTPSPTESSPPATSTPSATPTAPSRATDTPTAASLPPTATFTRTPGPLPPPPSPTPIIVIVTPTPLPVLPTQAPATGGACQPPASWVSYVVQPGDTLDNLAARTGVSVFELQQVNCLSAFNLRVGQTLYLPVTPPTPTVTYTPSPTGTRPPTPTRTATPTLPQIDSVTPNRVDRETADEEVIITVLGRNFQPNTLEFKVELRGPVPNVELQLGDAYSSTSFNAIVPVGLPVGTYSLVVTNPHGRQAIRASAYTIGPATPTDTPAPPPDIIRFTPTSGLITEEITLTVEGRNFRPNQSAFKVELQSVSSSARFDLDLGEIRTDTNFTAIIPPNTLTPGDYNLIVTNPDNRSDIAATAYRAL